MTASARARAVAGLALLAAVLQAPWARAAGDDIDDPKLARRLGSRVAVGAPAASDAASARAVAPASAASASAGASDAAAPPTPARRSDSPAVDLAASTSSAASTATPARDASTGRTPVLGLGYRRFSFVQLGATDPGSTTGTASSEPFNSLSLDFYPISRTVRFGLSTQYGWQSGGSSSRGSDYFIAQSASLGLQAPGSVVTPFAEAYAGGGYLRRFQFDRTIPTAYWQFGLDAGANFFLADHGFVSVALGYLRPVNGFLKEQSFTSVYVDTWSLKIGFGI